MKEEHITIGGIEFTLCEFAILQQVMKGKARKEIALARDCSTGTIDAHLRNIYNKTGIHKINELMAWGFANGFDHEGNYNPKNA